MTHPICCCYAILESNGFEVFTASDGKAGLEYMEQHAIDAAVIDNTMPEMSGVEPAQKIKHTHKDMPVLIVQWLIT